MDFVALDVETANQDRGSICQIGLAGFQGGALVREWQSLVNPEAPFSYFHTGVHGLAASDVDQAPAWPDLAAIVREWLTNRTVVCHTFFDRAALDQAWRKHGLEPPACQWLDSAQVARRAWAGASPQGYGLAALCELIGHEFRHHDALEDAKAAGAVLLAAQARTGLTVADWLERQNGRPAEEGSAGGV